MNLEELREEHEELRRVLVAFAAMDWPRPQEKLAQVLVVANRTQLLTELSMEAHEAAALQSPSFLFLPKPKMGVA